MDKLNCEFYSQKQWKCGGNSSYCRLRYSQNTLLHFDELARKFYFPSKFIVCPIYAYCVLANQKPHRNNNKIPKKAQKSENKNKKPTHRHTRSAQSDIEHAFHFWLLVAIGECKIHQYANAFHFFVLFVLEVVCCTLCRTCTLTFEATNL